MGLTVLDAGVLIGFLNSDDVHHAGAVEALRESIERHEEVIIPASALAESLVSPARDGEEAIAVVLDLLARVPIEVAPLDQSISVAAARIRANHPSMKLPDALVVATAHVAKADRLLTTDRGWPTAEQLGLNAVVSTL